MKKTGKNKQISKSGEMVLNNYTISDLTRNQIIEIIKLMNNTWPDNDNKSSEEEKVVEFYVRHPGKICHCIYNNKILIGVAESFPITIIFDKIEAEFMGIGGVCVYPKFRGKGLGSSIVRSAFARIDANEYPFCIFQTGVPHFYEKLGCKVIENKIINTNDHENPDVNPFWEKYVMIYPANILWSSGTIDLLRKGF